jgi:hypothetical protein
MKPLKYRSSASAIPRAVDITLPAAWHNHATLHTQKVTNSTNKHLLCFMLSIIIFSSTTLHGGEPMKTNATIWTTMHITKKDGEADRVVFPDIDFIKNCSPELKIIIALYSQCLIAESELLANALGNFSSLNEAQKTLLKDKEHFFENVKPEILPPAMLQVEINNKTISVKFYGGWGNDVTRIDKFKIQDNGKIEYIGQSKPLGRK